MLNLSPDDVTTIKEAADRGRTAAYREGYRAGLAEAAARLDQYIDTLAITERSRLRPLVDMLTAEPEEAEE